MVFRNFIICLMLFALAVSSWASGGAMCMQHVAAASEVAEAHAPVDHAHHAGAATTASDHSHHGVQPSPDAPTPHDCPCCDHCAAMCLASGCAAATVGAVAVPITSIGAVRLLASNDLFRTNPFSPSLFRPPISIVSSAA